MNNFGNDINRIIDDAVRSMDFGRLSRDIDSTVKKAVFGGPSMDDIRLSGDRPDTFDFNDLDGSSKRSGRDNTSLTIPVSRRPAGTFSGIGMIAAGICGTIGFGITAVSSLIFFGGAAVTLLLAGISGAGVCCILAGNKIRDRIKRFKNYLRIMKGTEFYKISDLAAKAGRRPEAVSRDLKKMIDKKMFLEGHIDDTGKWFIGNDYTFEQYAEARDRFKNRTKEEAEESRRREDETEEQRKLREVLEKGHESIDTIRSAKSSITDISVMQDLDDIEDIVTKIFKRVEEKPSLLPDIRRFMDYYLPTTVKLVNVYSDFEKKNVQSEDVAAAKKEIEQTLGNIETAFGKLLDELYQDTVMDVSTDISVLNSMFARDGLTDDGISK
ncbi:MAG: 5-bromo-4-chloroindolyl phosphate hydrolysis family protein [Eubacteriaceae bacterium]|jgi:5-bromo-4-chloroindolyl phosphate hydrolysis protein|nr:5-bromo-4-chloroindolyl phosphate hydrolysis family protein [Eubacteriaceae bacterium]